MAVTVVDKVITMTAQNDEIAEPIDVKSLRWTGATTAGHLLEISQSSAGDITKRIYSSVAAGSNYVEESLKELRFPFGLRLTDLDSGQVDIYYK